MLYDPQRVYWRVIKEVFIVLERVQVILISRQQVVVKDNFLTTFFSIDLSKYGQVYHTYLLKIYGFG